MRKSCGYHKSYDELCKKWCVKIIFTNYNFTEIKICGETNFPKKEKIAVHYYRIHHRKRPITAGLFRTGGDSLSPPVPNEPGGDANISPPVRNTTRR